MLVARGATTSCQLWHFRFTAETATNGCCGCCYCYTVRYELSAGIDVKHNYRCAGRTVRTTAFDLHQIERLELLLSLSSCRPHIICARGLHRNDDFEDAVEIVVEPTNTWI